MFLYVFFCYEKCHLFVNNEILKLEKNLKCSERKKIALIYVKIKRKPSVFPESLKVIEALLDHQQESPWSTTY